MNDTVRRIVTTHDPAGKVILLRMIAYASGFPGRQGERRGSVYDRRLQPTIGAGMKEHCIAYWPEIGPRACAEKPKGTSFGQRGFVS